MTISQKLSLVALLSPVTFYVFGQAALHLIINPRYNPSQNVMWAVFAVIVSLIHAGIFSQNDPSSSQ